MKKLFSLMAAALVSLTMLAGTNDLLWDYSNGAPKSSPDSSAAKNGAVYYASNVNDGPGTKNGLYGIKMNGSGYAYFTKAAVAGKLKLGFGPRSGSNPEKMVIQTWEGGAATSTVPTGLTSIDTTGAQSEYGFQVVELTAEQNNIYIKRAGTVESVLQYLSFTEAVERTFVDFEMIMCYMAADYDFTTLPAGVTASGTFNGDQHGYRSFTITVPVDGMVKFTIGDCQYGNQPIAVKNKAGQTITTLTYPAAGCYKNDDTNKDKVFSYNYLGAADTLTFGPIQYCNYFKAEAVEVTPCEIIFKDQNGAELGRVETIEGALLDTLPDASVLPAIGEGNVFRGWFYTNGKKAKIGDMINGNTSIQAKVTPVEEAIVGSVQTYDFTNPYFYPEDHETITTDGGAYHNNHGWRFGNGGSFSVQVAGNAVVALNVCQFSAANAVWNVVDANADSVGSVPAVSESDGGTVSLQYTGGPTTLTFQLASTGTCYLHKAVVYNVLDFVQKDTVTGYYIIPAGDAAALILTLVQAEAGAKLFLPNGTYDLGETVLTSINKNNIAIIGQSMEGVIIKNAPDYKTESINNTATLLIAKNVTGTYLQDLTLQNALDYYKNDNGRAVCLWDQGTKTVCKNVRMLSYQDTYYSNLIGAVKYFEDCEIHGTVDFICGDGSVYFYGTELICEQRAKDGGGSDAVTASNADASDKGYVFDHCTIRYAEGIQGTKPVVSFGRSWNNKPKTVFLNTFLDDSNGALNMTKDASAQKDKISRWTLGAMNALPDFFGEYNSVDKDGNVVTPASNNVTFVLGSSEKTMETVLSADSAAKFTMDYTLGDWSATAAADAMQAECEKEATDLEADAIYLAEADGEFVMLLKGSEFFDKLALYNGVEYTLRKANARGGFGKPAGENPEEAIENIDACNCKVEKMIRDGQVIIVRDGKEYNVLGAQL